MSITDIIVLIPVIPVLLLLPLWWLPWESWIWIRLPNPLRVLSGPYLLYVAFAAWYFKEPIWTVSITAVMGVCFGIWALLSVNSTRKQ
jgi:hypothetical protein